MAIRILYTIPSLQSCDGIASYAMNYYRHLDHEKYQLDFLVHMPGGEYVEEVLETGGQIYVIREPGFRNLVGFIKDVSNFFREHHDYDLIHCHVPNTAAFYLYYAKKYGIKLRLLHSHVTKSADLFLRRIRNDLMAPYAIRNAEYYAACSEDAGKALFGKRPFEVIHNAIDINRFAYSTFARSIARERLGLEDKVVIGSVGRFCNQKNPLFLIDIFERISAVEKDARLLLVGEGPLEDEMRRVIGQKKLEDKVIFAGSQFDVSPYYLAMDAFVLPSRYEGLGIVLIEAQISGLPVFASDQVPAETWISEGIQYLGLDLDAEVWADRILEKISPDNRQGRIREGVIQGYDISEQAEYVDQYYTRLLEHEI